MNTSLTRRDWLGAAAALLCSGPTATAADDKAQKIADVVNRARKQHDLATVLCGVWSGEGEVTTLAVGNSMTNVPATTDMHLRTGGVTEPCATTMLLQLVDKGKVSLDDKLSRWFPKLPQADATTLRMLCNCTAGIPDYVLSKTFLDQDIANPFRQWRAQELIDIALMTPPKYKPGTEWAYSHTNFVILGEVLQKVGDKPMAELVDQFIVKPLGLKETEFPTTAALRSPVLHAFSSDRGVYEDCTFWSPSWTSHCGMLTSTLHDLGVLARTIGSGKLVSKKSFEEFIAPTTVGLGGARKDLYFGLGIIFMNGWLVQNPRFNGYTLIFAHLPTKKLSIILANTNGPKTPAHTAYSTIIFKELVKLLAPDAAIPTEFK